MKNTKGRATLGYTYNQGDFAVRNVTNSNYVEPVLHEVTVRIKKFADVNYFKPGDIITYTLMLTNEGNYPATDINIREVLENQTLVEHSVNLKALEEEDFKSTVTFDGIEFILTELQPQHPVYISYQTVVDEEINPNYHIKSTSVVTVDDENIINSNPVEIEQKYAKLECDQHTDDVIYPNKPYEYTLTVKNVGNETAVNVEMSDDLPDDFVVEEIYVDDVATTDYKVENNVLSLMIGDVNPNASKLILIKGKIKRS